MGLGSGSGQPGSESKAPGHLLRVAQRAVNEAAALEAQPGGGGVGRRLGRVGHGPAARHAGGTRITTSAALPDRAAKNAKRFLPIASQRLKVRPLMSCAPSAKRPLGEVARYAATSRRVCWVAIGRWPSTMLGASEQEVRELSKATNFTQGLWPCTAA